MVDSFLQNKVLPGAELPKTEHKKLVTIFLIIAILLILIIIGYWYGVKNNPTSQDQMVVKTERQKVLDSLNNSNIPPPTEEERVNVVTQLQGSKTPKVTDEERAAIIKQLQGSSEI